MKNTIKKVSTAAFVFYSASLYAAAFETKPQITPTSDVRIFEPQEGLNTGLSASYLKPTHTDGDLEYGSFITLTSGHLDSRLKETDPDYTWLGSVDLDYVLPQTTTDIYIDYMHMTTNDKDHSPTANFPNQFIQTFVGGSWQQASGEAKYEINQYNLKVGHYFNLTRRFAMHPTIGLRYLDLTRNFHADYEHLLGEASDTFLDSTERSKFRGFGPVIGTDINYYIINNFGFSGHFGVGALAGTTSSTTLNTSSNVTFTPNRSITTESQNHTIPVMDAQLGLNYAYPYSRVLMNFEAGYQASYYYNVFERVNPLLGVVRNPFNQPIATQLTSLGLNGPYLKLVVSPYDIEKTSGAQYQNIDSVAIPDLPCGFFFGLTGDYLQPHADNDDLKYATLNTGSSKEVHPGYSWGGGAKAGYLFESTGNDIKLNYNFLNSRTFDDSVSGTGIQAENVAGDDGVTYTNASSNANYHIKQADLTLGQYFKPQKSLSVHPMVGVRYAQIKRNKDLNYSGGTSGLITSEAIDADLKSDFKGAGPLLAMDARYGFGNNRFDDGFGIIGYADMGMLIGNLNSTYKQTLNSTSITGSEATSTNSLHTGDLHRVVPAFDGSLGIDYRYRFNKNNAKGIHPELIAEVGYEASFYYKAVNVLYPTTFIGLQQTNSNLALIGPFLSLTYRGIPI